MMAKAKVTVRMNRPAMVRVIGGAANDGAYKAAQETRGRVLSNIHSLGRIDTGEMVKGLQVRKSERWSAEKPVYFISSSAKHTAFQEYGTRAHGPVTAKRLVFKIRGKGPTIFAKWVRGVTAGNFFRDALKALRAGDYR
jgi:hypothetical protein